ncbi:MAG: hypothetical protein HQ564_00205 [Candidatus Saganbacteria bacterium]|nr:hypothetical protein [Candidatus Saganbacteria bacterium]
MGLEHKIVSMNITRPTNDTYRQIDYLSGFLLLIANNPESPRSWEILQELGNEIGEVRSEQIKPEELSELDRMEIVRGVLIGKFREFAKIDITDREAIIREAEKISDEDQEDIVKRSAYGEDILLNLVAYCIYTKQVPNLSLVTLDTGYRGDYLRMQVLIAEVMLKLGMRDKAQEMIRKIFDREIAAEELDLVAFDPNYPQNNLEYLMKLLDIFVPIKNDGAIKVLLEKYSKQKWDIEIMDEALVNAGFVYPKELVEPFYSNEYGDAAAFLLLGQILFKFFSYDESGFSDFEVLWSTIIDRPQIRDRIIRELEKKVRGSSLDQDSRIVELANIAWAPKQDSPAQDSAPAPKVPPESSELATLTVPDLKPIRLFTIGREIEGLKKITSLQTLSPALKGLYLTPLIVAAGQTLSVSVADVLWDNAAKMAILAHSSFQDEIKLGFNQAIELLPKEVIVVWFELENKLYFLADSKNKEMIKK